MLMKEFVAKLRYSIQEYKGEASAQLGIDEFAEQQASLQELNELLIKYSDDNTLIDSEEVFQPFIRFLHKRWAKIAGTPSSYLQTPTSKINVQCTSLDLHMILACQQFHYKDRSRGVWLRPALTMNDVAEQVLSDINSLRKNRPQDEDSYVYLESLHALEELEALAKKSLGSSVEISDDSLEPFMQFLAVRWKNIQGSKADYRVNKSSDANVVCKYLAGYLSRAINFNRKKGNEVKVDPNKYLMPDIKPTLALVKPSDKLRDDVFAKLKSEETLTRDQQHLTNALRKANRGMLVFVNQLTLALNELEKDNVNNLDLLVYLESKHTIQEVKKLIEQTKDQPITEKTLAPFIDFLRIRWDVVDKTKAAYPANTQANKVCELIADQIALAGYQIDYLKRNQERLLRPVPHHDLTPGVANEGLRRMVTEYISNADDLLNEMGELDQSKWKEYLSNFDLAHLIKIITKTGATLDDLLQIKDVYTQDEARSKKLLLCFFEMYIKDRSSIEGAHKSVVGSVVAFTHLVKVPTGTEKIAAATEIQRLILSGVSLAAILADIKNPDSALYKNHNDSLSDKTLKKFVDQLERAVSVLPKPVVAKEEVLQLASK